MNEIIDILESVLGKDIIDILLSDRTTKKNILWATNDYLEFGDKFSESDEISYDQIKNDDVIIPRVKKTSAQKTSRSRNMAEVFTPSWVCNAQNNLVDEQWFGCKGVFNDEDSINHSWTTTPTAVVFPAEKSWQDYVSEERLEITCGEAPYLASRYDAASGRFIPVEDRIGLLDRKLRIVSENTEIKRDWIKYATIAYKSIYGFEWQGDNLLLARESLFLSFIEHYQHKFPNNKPTEKQLKDIATIISWNLWQMDGLKGVVPNSCHDVVIEGDAVLFGEAEVKTQKCVGCEKNQIHSHNGIHCRIMDWKAKKEIEFVSLMK